MKRQRSCSGDAAWGGGQGLIRIGLLLLLVTGCSSGLAVSEGVLIAEVEASTAIAAAPVVEVEAPDGPPEVVTIPYMDPETEKDIAMLSQWLKIHRPEGSGPHPTVFLKAGIPYAGNPETYDAFVAQLVDRGYAVVVVKGRTTPSKEPYRLCPGGHDLHCAFAWLVAHGASYGLDPDRIFIFGHSSGGLGALLMALQDEAVWAERLSECPYPVPEPAVIRGVITYDAFLGTPGVGTLDMYGSKMAQGWAIPGDQMLAATALLAAVPPQAWHSDPSLDENAGKLARLLPLTWVYDAAAREAQVPPFLLIYDHGGEAGGLEGSTPDFGPETAVVVEHMHSVGITATSHLLEDAGFTHIANAESQVPAQVAEALDVFVRGLSE